MSRWSLLAVGLLLPSIASAQVSLVSSTPGAGQTVSAPKQITLTFSTAVFAATANISIAGATVHAGGSGMVPTLTFAVPSSVVLSPGQSYTVNYYAEEADSGAGHSAKKSAVLHVSGQFTFTTLALAPPQMTGASPSANAALGAAPAAVSLTFNTPMNAAQSGATVQWQSSVHTTGKAAPVPVMMHVGAMSASGNKLTAPLSGPSGPGTYTVSWHAQNASGRSASGSYSFTVK
ncbi:MAG TPA: copper resistance protein CopC [Gemmatimonadales bacterium]|jgi:hypothetical protein|nr:copper resistance protein CopC [Gemmatimonadales bacterium]